MLELGFLFMEWREFSWTHNSQNELKDLISEGGIFTQFISRPFNGSSSMNTVI
jgi:hypothetical protein